MPQTDEGNLVQSIRELRETTSLRDICIKLNIGAPKLHRLIKAHDIVLSEDGRRRARDSARNKHKNKTISSAHRLAISTRLSKPLTDIQLEYIKTNLNKIPLLDITRHLNITYHILHKGINQLGLAIDRKFSAKIQAERSITHLDAARNASIQVMNNLSTAQRSRIGEKSRKLWRDPIYRLKVADGISKAYDQTDLRKRLSEIGKERFKTDPTVRAALFGDRPPKSSRLNEIVAARLDSLSIEYEREFPISDYKCDFKIGNILLEVNGDYWHNLPHSIRNDHAKATEIDRYYQQFKLRVIWEHEVKGVNGVNRLLEVIDRKIIEPVEIRLDDVTFTDNPKIEDVRRLLTSFHYIGDTGRKKFTFAMLLHNQPIAIACFGHPIRQNIAEGKILELTRLCRHPQFHNHNLMSRFLGKCLNELRKLRVYSLIISYADLRYHDGAIYRATNWKDCGETQPDYCYMSPHNHPVHKKTLYNRAVAAGVTEREYAELNNYIRTKIGTKRRFEYSL